MFVKKQCLFICMGILLTGLLWADILPVQAVVSLTTRVSEAVSAPAVVTVQAVTGETDERVTQVAGLTDRCFVPTFPIPSDSFFGRDIGSNPEAFHFGEFSGGVVHLLTLPVDQQQGRCPTLAFRRQGQGSFTSARRCGGPPCNDSQTVRLWELPELGDITEPSLLELQVICWNGVALENPINPPFFKYFVTAIQTSRDFTDPRRGNLGTEVTIEGRDLIQRLEATDYLVGLERIEMSAGGSWTHIFRPEDIGLAGEKKPVTVQWLGDPSERRNIIRFEIPDDNETCRLIKGLDIFITAIGKVTSCARPAGELRSYPTLLFHVDSCAASK